MTKQTNTIEKHKLLLAEVKTLDFGLDKFNLHQVGYAIMPVHLCVRLQKNSRKPEKSLSVTWDQI